MKYLVVVRPIKIYRSSFCLLFILLVSFGVSPRPVPAQEPLNPSDIFLPLILKSPNSVNPAPEPVIGPVTTNLADYPNGQVPRYEKFELTFDVNSVAQNLQFPYDPSPPPGLEPGLGITVNALFTPDDWQTVYTQPAFYYQEFEHEIKGGKDWFIPTGNFFWKVRFAPHQPGTWQYKLTAQDVGGINQTQPFTFTVVPSDNKGFVRVSQNDPRYFEHDDGTYFPGLGYNMNYRGIDWVNPIQKNENVFQIMSENKIQLIRIWLSQWAIFGSGWNPWRSHVDNGYIPTVALSFAETHPDSELSLKVSASWNRCVLTNWETAMPAVQRNTAYRIRVRYKTTEIPDTPVLIDSSKPDYGFVIKAGGWLWGSSEEEKCSHPDRGNVVSEYVDYNTVDWQILEGTINTGDSDFLPRIYLTMGNLTEGTAYIDYVWVQEDLGNGQYGPNIIYKPDMDHHRYMDQRNSSAFDKVVELAEAYDVYLRPVIHEKNDWIMKRIDFDGNFTSEKSKDYFYGNQRNITKMRWLQQAWWRYMQARWGYSSHIHSWELLNEGNPASTLHRVLTDEFGKYMHCRIFGVEVGHGDGEACVHHHPNRHMVSTSNWHSFPKDGFWASPKYPNVDFADIHQYIPEGDDLHPDAALATQSLSTSEMLANTGKPIIRGETGFTAGGSGPESDEIKQDTEGIWLHNFIWAGVNPGGLIESYWYEEEHIYYGAVDFRSHYKTYHNFIEDIPLSNGYYQDAEAQVTVTVGDDGDIRAWGQKDLVNGCAHLWLQNKNHTWKNVIDGISIPPVSGIVTLSGFQPGRSYTVAWWDPYEPDPIQQVILTENIVAQADGSLSIAVENLATDVALQVSSGGGCTP